jgi:hypothetical protein
MARILARYHGFKCTVLFAIDPKDGTIGPTVTDSIPGLQALESASARHVLPMAGASRRANETDHRLYRFGQTNYRN